MSERMKINWVISGITILCLVSIIIFPDTALLGATEGVDLWLKAVLPSLFPFIVLMNILIELKFFHVVGRLLGPVMKWLFNLPGVVGFIWISGITSGYPIGAKVTVDLMQRGELNKTQAQHTLNFCNNSGPLFLLGTVGVSMLGNKTLGYVLVISHIISSILLGMIYRIFQKKACHVGSIENMKKAKGSKTRRESIDIGMMLGESITKGMELMLLVGGFVILFSVIIHLTKGYGFVPWILKSVGTLGISDTGVTGTLEAMIYGTIEVTNGLALVAKEQIDLMLKMIAMSFLVGFSGLSIHAQTASVLKGSGLSFISYVKAKTLQGVISSILTYILLKLAFPIERVVVTSVVDKKADLLQNIQMPIPHELMVGILVVAAVILVNSYLRAEKIS